MRKLDVHMGAVAIAIAMMLVGAPLSYGQSSVGTYAGHGGSVVTNAARSEPRASASSNALPFTGLDVALLGGGGLLLVLGGAVIAGRPRPEEVGAPEARARGLTRLEAAE